MAAAPALDAVIPEPPSPSRRRRRRSRRAGRAARGAGAAVDGHAGDDGPSSRPRSRPTTPRRPRHHHHRTRTTRCRRGRSRFHTTHHDGDLVFKAAAADPEPAAPVAFERLTEPVALEDEDAPPEPALEAAAPTPAPEDAPGPSPFEAAIARRRAAVDGWADDAFAAHVLPGDGIDFAGRSRSTCRRRRPMWDEPPTPTLDAPAFASATPHQETFMDALPRRDLDAALDEAPGQGTWYDETYSDLSPLQDDRDAINAAADRAVAAAEACLQDARTRSSVPRAGRL